MLGGVVETAAATLHMVVRVRAAQVKTGGHALGTENVICRKEMAFASVMMVGQHLTAMLERRHGVQCPMRLNVVVMESVKALVCVYAIEDTGVRRVKFRQETDLLVQAVSI